MADSETALQPDLPSDESPNGQNNFSGPPAAEAGGILTIDLAATRRQLAHAGEQRDAGECAAVVKADGYGCGIEPVARGAGAAPAARPSSSPILPRRGACALSAPDAAIYVLNGLLPGTAPAFAETQRAPGDQQPGRARRMGRASSRRSGWRGGAALHVDTGMNRLGLSPEEAAALAPRIRAGKPRHHAVDEPSRLRRAGRSIRSTTSRSSCSAKSACCIAASPPRSPIPPASSSARRRIATWCGRASRSTASTRRRAQPNPMRPVVELQARIVQVRNVAQRRDRRLRRRPGPPSARRGSRSSRSAMPTAIPRAASATDTRPRRARRSSPASAVRRRPHLDGPARASTSPTCRTAPCRRGDMVDPDRRRRSTSTRSPPRAGTIGYEVLTSLGQRYHRVYRAAEKPRSARFA